MWCLCIITYLVGGESLVFNQTSEACIVPHMSLKTELENFEDSQEIISVLSDQRVKWTSRKHYL